MATFFGEIRPEFSRAVEEDEDDDEEQVITTSSIVRWSPEAREEISKNGCIRCTVLIVAIGQAATSFTETYLLSNQASERLGVICSGIEDTDVFTLSQTASTDKTCYIHRLKDKPTVLVVQCKVDVTPEQAYSWTQQVLSNTSESDTYVGVLCTRQTSEYTSELPHGDLPAPFLRSLKTTCFRGTPRAVYLEQPNIVSGLPAQIVTYCQCHQLPAVLYVCYTDVPYLDISTIKAFKILLASTPIKDIVEENPDADLLLSKLVQQHSDHNTLYI